MRSVKEMMKLILSIAEGDERVRAVTMCGSRMDMNTPKDRYQDYDIVYVVSDVSSFTCNHDWIKVFGNPIMVQMPEQYQGAFDDGRYIYLVLFEDGNRIDLTLVPVDKLDEIYEPDSLEKVLVDKDGIMPQLAPPSDRDFYIKKPTKKLYDGYCNNYWWILQNVAKGIMRDEVGYATMMFGYCRDCLENVIMWYIAIDNSFEMSVGKCCKKFKKYLSSDIYERYTASYPSGNYDDMWSSIFTTSKLFSKIAKTVAEHYGYEYNKDDEKNMVEYLERVKQRYDSQFL